jgi:hypothetical protein
VSTPAIRLDPGVSRLYEDARAIVKMGFDTESLDCLCSESFQVSAEEVFAMAFPGRT